MQLNMFTLEINNINNQVYDPNQALENIKKLIEFHNKGYLGGETMPEDVHPKIPNDSKEMYLYLTLPMSLNYQRNSYKLWESATASFNDEEVHEIFDPKKVISMTREELQTNLTKYKVALQKNKQTEIWFTICKTLHDFFDGDVRNLFILKENSVEKIRNYIQKEQKKGFPYLSGNKICNYWLYVIEQYTHTTFTDRNEISVAPDTHVIQSSIKLGLIDWREKDSPKIQSLVNEAWKNVLHGTDICLIDIHTPLWLWSRGGFKDIRIYE